jgi:hypothetical protein
MLNESFEGLNLKDFFLQLSTPGLAFRCCELIRVDGSEIGVTFADGPDNRGKKTS